MSDVRLAPTNVDVTALSMKEGDDIEVSKTTGYLMTCSDGQIQIAIRFKSRLNRF